MINWNMEIFKKKNFFSIFIFLAYFSVLVLFSNDSFFLKKIYRLRSLVWILKLDWNGIFGVANLSYSQQFSKKLFTKIRKFFIVC